jgi:hypothetical protein
MSNVRRHVISTMRVILYLMLLLSVLGACGGEGSASDRTDTPFTTLAKPCPSNVTVSEGVVARTQSEFDAVWGRCFGGGVPPQPPSLDFDALQVMGIFLGSRPDGCYLDSVSITRIRKAGDRLLVIYKEHPPSSGGCTFGVVNPGHLVSTARTELQVEFVAE